MRESHLFCLEEDDFWKMLTLCPELRRTVLGHMANRMQDLQILSQQREKLAALGTLAAGLAHELNNPASAAHRTAEHLQNSLSILQSLALEFIQAQLIPKQKDHLLMLQQNGLQFSANRYLNDPVVQSEQEDELADWLESQGIANGWKLAPTFVSAGFDTAQLSPLVSHQTLPALIWLEATLTTSMLLIELEQSTNRVAELVQAIKMYSYMDKMPCQEIDIHEGIDNTLIILSHKIKQYNTEVKRKYSLGLPKLFVHGSELNQVWTNLIDNAIDAAGEDGTIRIQTFTDNAMLIVEIIDTGPGISPEVLPRIFEPFFTTKAIGKGTGLGLEIAYRIVVNQHHGEIRVRSQPGNTQFQVWLPVSSPNQE
jgi:signal transduction histidine kinase